MARRAAGASSIDGKTLIIKSKATSAPRRAGTTGILLLSYFVFDFTWSYLILSCIILSFPSNLSNLCYPSNVSNQYEGKQTIDQPRIDRKPTPNKPETS